jgi:hypothetical protein
MISDFRANVQKFIGTRWPWIDRRMAITLLCLMTAAYILTAIMGRILAPHLGGPFVAETWRAFYAAWVEDLLFFSLVGSVVAIISYRSPEKERFSNRVAILYGGPAPPFVLRYSENQIKKLAGYATLAERTLEIEAYSTEYDAFKVRILTRYQLRNILCDEDFVDDFDISFNPDNFEKILPEIGKVNSIQIGEVEKLSRPEPLTKDGFNMRVPFRIAASATETMSAEFVCWLKANTDQIFLPRRLTERFCTEIVNRTERTVRIESAGKRSDLVFGVAWRFERTEPISPGDFEFSFRLIPE